MIPEPYKEKIITVSCTTPLLPASKSYFDWSNVAELEEDPLDTDLGWPAGTLAVLRFAFKMGLTRTTRWELGTNNQKSAILKAAEVYKRGVACETERSISVLNQYRIEFVDEYSPPKDELLIIDRNVALAWNFPASSNAIILSIDEHSKNLTSVAKIRQLVNEHQLASSDRWTIIGGGVLADVAAFCASLMSKKFTLVPTTLLSMIDACVGGKTGVNFEPFGKNQVGLFSFPIRVIISNSYLKTLSQRDLASGLSEAFKHAVIAGNVPLAETVACGLSNRESLIESLPELVRVKSEIVAKDPMEANVRVVLNFGHTLAHALERISHTLGRDSYVLHGEAVSVGLTFAIYLSNKLGYLSDSIFNDLFSLLLSSEFLIKPDSLKAFLRTNDLASSELLLQIQEGILLDKKNDANNTSMWVLLKNWGSFVNTDGRYITPVSDKEFIAAYVDFVKTWTNSY